VQPAKWTGAVLDPRRIAARIEASVQKDGENQRQEIDIDHVVTSVEGEAHHVYESGYCARGKAENLIKLHRVQHASDLSPCYSATANQVRLVLSTG
jgi:Transposase DDE domain group 1